MEKVSVIIPTYNREKTILRALHSVLEQTYTNLEVLVIDDGSTDGTSDMVNSIADNRVQYIVLEKNQGAANARNVGAKMASGEWIAFQDSDDCWYRDKIEKQIQYIHRHPEYSMVYCMYDTILQNGEHIIVPGEPWPDVMEGDMIKTLLVRNVMGAPVMFVRRNDFLAVGGFSTDYKALEDWEYAIRFAREFQIGFVPEVLMDVYLLNGGVSSNLGAYFECRCKMLAAYKEEMIRGGVFNIVMEDILNRAQKAGVLELAKKLMMLYLSR